MADLPVAGDDYSKRNLRSTTPYRRTHAGFSAGELSCVTGAPATTSAGLGDLGLVLLARRASAPRLGECTCGGGRIEIVATSRGSAEGSIHRERLSGEPRFPCSLVLGAVEMLPRVGELRGLRLRPAGPALQRMEPDFYT